jgi:hypothetical protein
MKFRIVAIPLVAAICLGSAAVAGGAERADGDEQRRRDRGGDNRRWGRSAPRPRLAVPARPNIIVNLGRNRGPRYYRPAHFDRWARQRYRWSPIGYAPWSLIHGSVGFSNFGVSFGSRAYGPPYGAAYGYYGPAYPPYYASGYDTGGVRLRMRPRDAQVFVDGYYAGIVDDFDGTFQQLRLEPGGHRIEIRMPGFEDLDMDVHVQPGRTITLHEDLRPRP